jgi:hypothetical protein
MRFQLRNRKGGGVSDESVKSFRRCRERLLSDALLSISFVHPGGGQLGPSISNYERKER